MVDTPRHGLSTINEEGDSRSTTPRPEQQRTPSIELSRRRTEEHARLAGIDQRLENLDKDRTEVPDALKDKGWEDCKNKLTDLKTTTSDTKDIEKIIESYENKINDAKLKKLRESMFERWNRYRELCRNLCGPLGEGRSSQALQDFSDRIVIDYNSAGSLEDRQKVHARFEKRIREMELDESMSGKKERYRELRNILYGSPDNPPEGYRARLSLADVEDYLDTATKNYDSAKSLKDKQEVHDAFKERLDQMEYDRELIKETEDASMGTGYSQFKNEWVKSHNGDWNGMNEAWKAKQEAMQEEKFDFTQFLNEPYDASSGWSSTM